jgi:hypothetical protein
MKAVGYTSNGEGQYSRHSAQPHENVRLKINPRYRIRGEHTLAQQIRETETRINWMECELRIETDKTKRERLAHDLGIRGRFLTKLMIERDGE